MGIVFSFLVPCVVIMVVCIPLMLRLVPPNRFYGLRTRRTLGDRELWFRANRFAGCALFIAALSSAAVYLVAPEYASGRSIVGLAVLIVPIGMAIAASFAYVSRLSRQ